MMPTPDVAPAGAAHMELIDRMARATAAYPFKVWGFGESIAMEALLAAGGASRAVAAGLIERWARDTRPLRQDPLAHVAPGVPVLVLFEQTGEPALIQRARELALVLAGATVGAHGARIHRPDLPGWEHEVWVDCMHLDGPFLARLATATGETTWADIAANALLSHARTLQDERSGLFSHGFDDATGRANGVHWGRGQGWALLGMVDTLHELPTGHGARETIAQRLDALIAGLRTTEGTSGTSGTSGTWRTVVDDPDTWVEPSVAAFVALGVGRAVRWALVDPAYESLADRAWDATRARVSSDGYLVGVSDATPVGPDALHYNSRGAGVFPWGQGPALLAGLERNAVVSIEGGRP